MKTRWISRLLVSGLLALALGCGDDETDGGGDGTGSEIPTEEGCQLEDGSTVPVGWEQIDTDCTGDWHCGCGCVDNDEIVCTDCECTPDTSE